MCFSPTASFVAGTVLIPVGAYCIYDVMKSEEKKPLLYFAALPLLFGVQQISEGFVWLSILNNNSADIRFYSLIFLFFAFGFWPFYCPLMVYKAESYTNPYKKYFKILTILGALLGAGIYLPLLTNSVGSSTLIINNSICYNTDRAEVSRNLMLVGYLILTLIPFLLSSFKKIKFFGLILIISVIVSAYFYNATFFSVWCFFAALLSAYLLYFVGATRLLRPGAQKLH